MKSLGSVGQLQSWLNRNPAKSEKDATMLVAPEVHTDSDIAKKRVSFLDQAYKSI